MTIMLLVLGSWRWFHRKFTLKLIVCWAFFGSVLFTCMCIQGVTVCTTESSHHPMPQAPRAGSGWHKTRLLHASDERSQLNQRAALVQKSEDTNLDGVPHTMQGCGLLWPQPHTSSLDESTLVILDSSQFNVFINSGIKYSVIDGAIRRYNKQTFTDSTYISIILRRENDASSSKKVRHETKLDSEDGGDFYAKSDNLHSGGHNLTVIGGVSFPQLSRLEINFKTCGEMIRLSSDESYEIAITSQVIALTAATCWGILRGLQTLSQLTQPIGRRDLYALCQGSVRDGPRYSHRGLMIDTSRHFIPTHLIKLHLDAMEQSKLNVLHWHLTDNESFSYKSRFTNKTTASKHVSPRYSLDEVREIVDFAKHRGIRVIPELDTPAHTRSWETIRAGILDKTCSTETQGVMNISSDVTYDVVKQLLAEMRELFQDVLHLGGDEMPVNCWTISNIEDGAIAPAQENDDDYPDDKKYQEGQSPDKIKNEDRRGKSHNEIVELVHKRINQYIRKLILLAKASHPRSETILWEDALTPVYFKLPDTTILQMWQDYPSSSVLSAISGGQRVIHSTGWYLNYQDSNWKQLYNNDPQAAPWNENGQANIIGGEACVWTETIDDTNIMQVTWPRAAAVAEKLWSTTTNDDMSDVEMRLRHFRCRLLRSGIRASPVGPGQDCQNL